MIQGRAIMQASAVALIGALLGALCLVLAFARRPALAWELDRDWPGITSGFYAVERHGELTFAWTSSRALLRLRGLDRREPWQCTVRFRGARPALSTQPLVQIAVDEVTLASRTATNDYVDVAVVAPQRPDRPGLTLTISSSPEFVPGPSDPRGLGVEVDRLRCEPVGAAVLPPRRAIRAAAMSGAVFGAVFGLLAGGLAWAVGGTLLVTMAQAVAIAAGPAPYSAYQDSIAWIALCITAAMAVGVTGAEWGRGQRFHPAARFVVLFSGAVLFLKLLALLHPSKVPVDALFHAHRLEWVMDGRYYFTQPLPSGVQFPYAIALYVFAAPWSALTRDYVALLRIVVCVAQTLAGALLYPIVVRYWNDRPTGILAVVLFHLVPLPFVIIGNANLTHAFAQSAALVTVAAATLLPLATNSVLQLAGLSLLSVVAFLSHVGTFPLLLSTLVGISLLYRIVGGAALTGPARAVFLAAALAVGVSVVAYYGHFGEVFKTLGRIRTPATAVEPAPTRLGSDRPPRPEPAETTAGAPLGTRVVRAGALGVTAFGWPIVVLAALGGWQARGSLARNRLGLMLVASGATCVIAVACSVLTPVAPPFQRYTDEFILRVYDATGPAVVILAALGAVAARRAGRVATTIVAALLLGAALGGVRQWLMWMA